MATFTFAGSNCIIKYNTDGGSTWYLLSNGDTIIPLTTYYFLVTGSPGYYEPRMTHSGGGTGWLTHYENDTESKYQCYFNAIPANTTLTRSATTKPSVLKTATLSFNCYGKNSSGTIIKSDTSTATGSKTAYGNPDYDTTITGVTTASVTPSGLWGTGWIDHVETGTRTAIGRCKDNYTGAAYETFATVSQTSCWRGKFTTTWDNSASSSATMDITVPAGSTSENVVTDSRIATLPKTDIGGTGWNRKIGNVTLPSNSKYTRTGYSYTRWVIHGTTEYYTAGSTIGLYHSTTSPGSYNYNFVPDWVANTYTITFDKQGGVGGTDTITCQYDAKVSGNYITPPTKDGYIFIGYFTGTSGSGTSYFNANGLQVENWAEAADTTLYAYWQANTDNLKVKQNGNWVTVSPYVKVADQWYPASVYTKVSGIWKLIKE